MHSRRDPTAVIPGRLEIADLPLVSSARMVRNPTPRAAGTGPRVSRCRQEGIAGEVASQGAFPGRSAHLRPQDLADLPRYGPGSPA